MSFLFPQEPDNRQTKPAGSDTDSIFGMVLAQSFMGMIYGAGVEQAWEVGELASEAYKDRYKKDRTNGQYNLGVKNSLGPQFARSTDPQGDNDNKPRYLPSIWEYSHKKSAPRLAA